MQVVNETKMSLHGTSSTVHGPKTFVTLRRSKTPWSLLSWTSVAMMRFHRGVHSQNITRNLKYISSDKMMLKTNPETLKFDRKRSKPLCLMFDWLMAPHSHILKYASLYLEQGFDVLSVACTPWQLMWPVKGSQLVAADLLKLVTANEELQPLVVHGFSVGGYLWSELLLHAVNNRELYQPVLDRVAAQIWDSPADITQIPIGFPMAVFPSNKFLKKTFRAYIEYHMKTFHEAATVHYLRASRLYHASPCRAPALFLLSKTDPVGDEKTIRAAYEGWRHLGIECTWQCWAKSLHVQHYKSHPQEYTSALHTHLDACGLIARPQKIAAYN